MDHPPLLSARPEVLPALGPIEEPLKPCAMGGLLQCLAMTLMEVAVYLHT